MSRFNNILFDKDTDDPVAIIDLDTVWRLTIGVNTKSVRFGLEKTGLLAHSLPNNNVMLA